MVSDSTNWLASAEGMKWKQGRIQLFIQEKLCELQTEFVAITSDPLVKN